ncbi:MAG: winged helix-turn-helix domain-containing protein, partial [Acidobacteriota bacterium]|nr:winged helix-turn-helix domain-containing protein [Acidobacteriota bacterium]
MQKLTHQIYFFDEFTLDVTRGSLARGGSEIKLRPKSFEVLKFLVENGGRLITKDEMIQVVWQGMAVTDDSLVQCLKDIRRALNDKSQTYIKTVQGRGYIFEKEVSENGSTAQIYTEETAGVHIIIEETEETNGHGDAEILRRGEKIIEPRKQSKVANLISAVKRHKIATAVGSVVLVAVIIAGIVFANPLLAWWFKPPSIAVLPIVNATGDANNDYISDGLTESLITSLTQLNERGKTPRLRVTAQNTVFIFKGKEIEPRSVGRELGVDTVLASKLFHQDGLRIIKFEMINIADGSIVWSKQYAVGFNKPDEFLAMQNEIPGDVAAQLPLSLSDADRQNLTRRYTQNAKAYDLYLKGRAGFLNVKPSSIRKSIEYFQQAIDLDPNFALAYWAMGVSYRAQGVIDERPDKEANEKAVDLFQKALKIDNTLTVANNAMKINEAHVWNWKAIENTGPSHPGYGDYLIAMGRIDEKLEIGKRRLSVDPYSPFLNFTHCGTFLSARRYDDAIAQCRKTLNLVPAADNV